MKNKYLFEDNRKDPKSKALLHLYPSTFKDEEIEFCGGVSNVFERTSELANSFDFAGTIFAFIDFIPGNKNIYQIFNTKFRELILSNPKNKIMVIPLICSEYYLIQSLPKFLWKNEYKTDIHHIIDLDWYKPSNLITTPEDNRKAKNFENFCKLALLKAFQPCISHKKKRIRKYLRQDCLCDKPLQLCEDKNYTEKCIQFVKKFPYIPPNSHRLDTITMSWDDLVKLHRNLVTQYNETSLKFKKADPNGKYFYSVKPHY